MPCTKRPGSLNITKINEGSALRGTDARVNDIITHVNGEPLSVPEVLLHAVESGKAGDTIKLTIARVNSADQRIETLEVNAELIGG